MTSNVKGATAAATCVCSQVLTAGTSIP
jgi:hypothetical protein